MFFICVDIKLINKFVLIKFYFIRKTLKFINNDLKFCDKFAEILERKKSKAMKFSKYIIEISRCLSLKIYLQGYASCLGIYNIFDITVSISFLSYKSFI